LVGAAGQVYKILASYNLPSGGHGEYLRLSYDGASGIVAGYPVRSMMGWIHGEFFAEPMPDPIARTATIIAQASKLRRRGFSIPLTQLNKHLAINAKLVRTVNGNKRNIVVPVELVLTPRIFGGIGVESDSTSSALLEAMKSPNSISQLSPIDFNQQGYAVLIPSGEGKSTLTSAYPSIFTDHDTLIDQHVHQNNLEAARWNGNWTPVNAYLRSVVPPKHKLLLTWSTHTLPAGFKVIGALMLNKPTKLRANLNNRKSIIAELSPKRIHYVTDYAAFVAKALDLARSHFLQLKPSAFQEVFNISGFSHPRGLMAPTWQVEGLQASNVLKRNKISIVDMDTLAKLGTKRTEAMDESILKSCISGAIPKAQLRLAIDTYADSIDKYISQLQKVEYQVTLPTWAKHFIDTYDPRKNIFTHLGIISLGPSHYIGHVEFQRNIASYPHARRIVHNYASIERIMQASGFSVGDVFRQAIDRTRSTGHHSMKINKITNFISDIQSLYGYGQLKHQKRTDSAVLNRYVDFLTTHDITSTDGDSAIYHYALGEFDLLPPTNQFDVSSDCLSFIRDLALYEIENSPVFHTWLGLTPQVRSLVFHLLEHRTHTILVTDVFHRVRVSIQE
jgi:hypothetical protein